MYLHSARKPFSTEEVWHFVSYFSVLYCNIPLTLTIDSLTKCYISRLSKNKRAKLNDILNQRKIVTFFTRIDTATFDFAFIKEDFCYYEVSGNVFETYFSNNDTIPKKMYLDGAFIDPKNIYYDWNSKDISYYQTLYPTLHPLIYSYSKLRPTQELAYEKVQIWSHGIASVT